MEILGLPLLTTFKNLDEPMKQKAAFRCFLDSLTTNSNIGMILRLLTNIGVAYEPVWQFPGGLVVSRPGSAHFVVTCCSFAFHLAWNYQIIPSVCAEQMDRYFSHLSLLPDVDAARALKSFFPSLPGFSGRSSFEGYPIVPLQMSPALNGLDLGLLKLVNFENDELGSLGIVESNAPKNVCSVCNFTINRSTLQKDGKLFCPKCAIGDDDIVLHAPLDHLRRDNSLYHALMMGSIMMFCEEIIPEHTLDQFCWLCGRFQIQHNVTMIPIEIESKIRDCVSACEDCAPTMIELLKQLQSTNRYSPFFCCSRLA